MWASLRWSTAARAVARGNGLSGNGSRQRLPGRLSPADDRLKSWVPAKVVVQRIHVQKQHGERVLVARLDQPLECPFPVAQPGIRTGELDCGNEFAAPGEIFVLP